jgi:hypothetical protein
MQLRSHYHFSNKWRQNYTWQKYTTYEELQVLFETFLDVVYILWNTWKNNFLEVGTELLNIIWLHLVFQRLDE